MGKIIDEPARTYREYRFFTRLQEAGMDYDKVDFSTFITRTEYDMSHGKLNPQVKSPGIRMNIPVMTAAMQSVTGDKMAVAMAQLGGLGCIFQSQPIESEVSMVKAAKRAKAGFATALEVLHPEHHINVARELINRTGYNTIPVTLGNPSNYGELVGVVEGPLLDDLEERINADVPMVKHIMRPFNRAPLTDLIADAIKEGDASKVICIVDNHIHYREHPTTLEEANELMRRTRRKYIPIVNPDGTLKAMVFMKDAMAHRDYPKALVDANKRYLVAAAINTHDYTERSTALAQAGADILVVDASDGYSEYMKQCVQWTKEHTSLPVIAGNVVDSEGFMYLVTCGADAVKFGIGGGSICITQEQKGIGRGQASACRDIAAARDAYFMKTGIYIPIISDGGIEQAMDVAMALFMGSDGVMVGSYVAGCDETPTKTFLYKGKVRKPYWGEGSPRAKEFAIARYSQSKFDEGVEGSVPYVGSLHVLMDETFAKMGSTMVSCGAMSIPELREKGVVQLVSEGAMREGAVHNVEVTQ